MVQPIKTNKKVVTAKKKKTKVTDKRLPPKPKNTPLRRSQRPHKEYGTSKLELRFAKEFLDKLGIEYIYQFKAESIGRYFDFKIKDGPIIEVNGSYWHGDKRLYEEKDLNKTQKRAIYIDEIKRRWALAHGIPIYYVWEKDINENPQAVMKYLEKILYIDKKRKERNGRH